LLQSAANPYQQRPGRRTTECQPSSKPPTLKLNSGQFTNKMSVFEHKYFGNPQDICDNPHSRNCIYCKEKLSTVPIENASWKTTDEELLTVHEETRIQYKEIHNLEDCLKRISTRRLSLFKQL